MAPPEDSSPHILVVDDDKRLRDLLERYLTRCGFRVSTADSAASARRQTGGIAFDLIVLDVMMPGENGLELTRSVRGRDDVPILLLTAMSEIDDRIAGLEVGADDYVAKPFEPRELVLRIQAILRRGARTQAPATLRLGACSFDPARGVLSREGGIVRLTSGEAEILRVLARSPGRTISRVELMPQAEEGNIRSVDVAVTRLRRKIEPDPKSPRYLQTVWGQGYALWPDEGVD